MRKQMLQAGCMALLAAVAVAGIAEAAKPTVIRAGNLIVAVNGGVAPKALPKKRMAPVALRVAANIRTTDGSQPPVARKVTLDFDKHGDVNAKGLTRCTIAKLEARTTRDAKSACPKAIVGHGKTTVRVAFPESIPFTASGPLLVFNGGVRGRTTTMLIHAYVDVPTPTALVTTVKVKRIHKGRFGTRADARIPRIANGAGALTKFNLAIKRKFRRHGKSQGYLLARCANGRLFAHGTVAFVDGSRLAGRVVRPCRQRG